MLLESPSRDKKLDGSDLCRLIQIFIKIIHLVCDKNKKETLVQVCKTIKANKKSASMRSISYAQIISTIKTQFSKGNDCAGNQQKAASSFLATAIHPTAQLTAY